MTENYNLEEYAEYFDENNIPTRKSHVKKVVHSQLEFINTWTDSEHILPETNIQYVKRISKVALENSRMGV